MAVSSCAAVWRSDGTAPVLAMSALDLADEAFSAGASAFLAKPVVPLQFVSTVRDLLGRARSHGGQVGDLLMDRLSSGNTRLDEVLGGGLVLDAITLVVGAPGTGKTILAEQCLFANATPERPGLYLSTVSEPFDKLLRYGQSLEFFDPPSSAGPCSTTISAMPSTTMVWPACSNGSTP